MPWLTPFAQWSLSNGVAPSFCWTCEKAPPSLPTMRVARLPVGMYIAACWSGCTVEPWGLVPLVVEQKPCSSPRFSAAQVVPEKYRPKTPKLELFGTAGMLASPPQTSSSPNDRKRGEPSSLVRLAAGEGWTHSLYQDCTPAQ